MKFALVATVAAINFAISASTPCSDDSAINAANNATLCQLGIHVRPLHCVNQINGLNYPSCDPNMATSYNAPISNFSTACSALSNDLTARGGTCTLGNTADYLWANPNTGADCDASINAANNWTLSQACTNDLQGGSPLSLSAIYADIAARSSTTVYRYGLCGSTNCAADIAKIVNSYPNCTATTAPSLLTWVQGYAPTCVAVNASIANSTCTLANYADYNWARYQVQLTPQCANALSMSTSSLWYSAIQAAALSNNAFTNAFCTSSDCISFTTSTINMLGDCSVTSGESLFKTATNLINYCNAIAPTTPPAAKSSQPSTTAATSGGTTTATPTPTPTKSSASTAFGLLAVGVVASGMLLLA
ncbi:hypothetical protein LEN26_004216 [Aphanomyces euteiches]|nr:hypothetical protein AeMF1_000702 [Aphanomyces euteiches]KAH9149572.1 hypothetical protein LEN26_004216 [Aphanomyces euteiches]KAH9195554.1 hypothetical protein AeNC1_002471 [Aphanomyces euteiches]